MEDAVYGIAYALHKIIYNCSSITFADYCNRTLLTGADIYDVLSRELLQGTTGPLAFSDAFRTNTRFDIVQSNAFGQLSTVGSYYDNGSFHLDRSMLSFKGDDRSTVPVSAVVPYEATFNSPASLGVGIVSCLVIFACLLCSLYFLMNRHHKVVKNASPVFCQLILLGIVMMCAGALLWCFRQTAALCTIKIWVSVIGFGLIMGNILAKTYRIFRVYTNFDVHSSSIPDRHLLYFSAAVVALEILLLSIFTFFYSLPTPAVYCDKADQFYCYTYCALTDNEEFQTVMTIILITFNAILIMLAAIVAFLTRNVDSAYNESVYIAATVRGDMALMPLSPSLLDCPLSLFSFF